MATRAADVEEVRSHNRCEHHIGATRTVRRPGSRYARGQSRCDHHWGPSRSIETREGKKRREKLTEACLPLRITLAAALQAYDAPHSDMGQDGCATSGATTLFRVRRPMWQCPYRACSPRLSRQLDGGDAFSGGVA